MPTPLLDLTKRLNDGGIVILDGGMGNELRRRGVPVDSTEAWSATAQDTHPQVVRQLHAEYIRVGADVIITNTFACCRHTLSAAGLEDRFESLNRSAVDLACQARDEVSAERPVAVAGSISTFLSVSTFEVEERIHHLPRQARANYLDQARILAQAGVDLLVLEMMQDIEHTGYAIEAALSTGLPVWVGFSCSTRADGEVALRDGGTESFAQALGELLSPEIALASVMHTDIEDTVPALQVLADNWPGPIGCYPHRGPSQEVSEDAFVAEARCWLDSGARAVGGCCGFGPSYIERLAQALGPRLHVQTGQ